MKKAAASLVTLVIVILSFLAINTAKGTVSENFYETGCVLEFSGWSARSRHQLSLNQREELLVAIACDKGSVAFDIRAQDGTEAYTGKGLKTGNFTVKVPAAGRYLITIEGNKATGRVEIKTGDYWGAKLQVNAYNRDRAVKRYAYLFG